jgi:hypothetical protein
VGAQVIPDMPESPPRKHIKGLRFILPKHIVGIVPWIVSNIRILALAKPTSIEAVLRKNLMIGLAGRKVNCTFLFIMQLNIGQGMNGSCVIDLTFSLSLLFNKRDNTVNDLLINGVVCVANIAVIVLA